MVMLTCESCGSEFGVRYKSRKRRFCNRICLSKSRPFPATRQYTSIPIEERFLKFVRKTESCWLWTGYLDPRGYARLYWKREEYVRGTIIRRKREGNVQAAKSSWMILRGEIPPGFHVLHNCPGQDNPSCVNPDHLYLGTPQNNMDDMARKGRSTRGEKSSTAKLTEAKVIEMRSKFAAGLKAASIASEYGISKRAVYRIIDGSRWKHVPLNQAGHPCP